MKKCYIVGAGDMYGSIYPCEDDLVIAADGGIKHLIKNGIVPDVIVGDFDSVEDETLLKCGIAREDVTRVKGEEKNKRITLFGKEVDVFSYPVMKDETDMHLAYKIGASRGYSLFELYGGVGGREDHTFANICLLYEMKNSGDRGILIGNEYKITVIKNEEIVLHGKPFGTFSVFAFGSDAHGVFIEGAKYNVENADLTQEFPLGVSNSYINTGKAKISVISGTLLIFF